MGQCITRTKDFDSFCDRYKEAIIERVEEKFDYDNHFDWKYHEEAFMAEANKLWESCADADPLGGDGIDD